MLNDSSCNQRSIKLVDLYKQHEGLLGEIQAVIDRVITDSAFIRGPDVEQFEENFGALLGAKHCVSCANGTDSLFIAMKSLGIKPGDEVIVPAHSWISTSETVTQAGGKVIFCDTDHTYTIDPKLIEAKITPRTVGIIPVHLYGQPADMDTVMDISSRHGLWVVEDCAQSHLAKYKGRVVGTIGNAGSFSFYPGKNLGAMGDAGALITNNQELATRMAMFARHGGLKKGSHEIEGINSRLDGIQAAILNIKLPHLPKWNARRQEIARIYQGRLSGVPGLKIPEVAKDREHVWHLFVIECEQRDQLAKYLNLHGIQTAINYPIALPFLPAYMSRNYQPQDYPNSHRAQSRILSLPMYPELEAADVNWICDLIIDFFKSIPKDYI